MAVPVPVDRLEITVIVDNVTDNLSTNTAPVSTELQRLRARPGPGVVFDWDCMCCAAHGLSLLLTAWVDGVPRTIMFDTGPTQMAFRWNAMKLGVRLGEVEAIVLSHGHSDHAGGLTLAVSMIREAGGDRPVDVWMHPHMFAPRGSRKPDGEVLHMTPIPSPDEIALVGGTARVTREDATIADGRFWVSGEIPRVTPFERGMAGQIRQEPDGTWIGDELMPDERYLAVEVRGLGLVVFSACSHAGIANVVLDARARFPGRPLHLVMGGFHLSGVTEAIIAPTVDALFEAGVVNVGPGHCTGWRALNAIVDRFGEARTWPTAVGKVYTLAGA